MQRENLQHWYTNTFECKKAKNQKAQLSEMWINIQMMLQLQNLNSRKRHLQRNLLTGCDFPVSHSQWLFHKAKRTICLDRNDISPLLYSIKWQKVFFERLCLLKSKILLIPRRSGSEYIVIPPNQMSDILSMVLHNKEVFMWWQLVFP